MDSSYTKCPSNGGMLRATPGLGKPKVSTPRSSGRQSDAGCPVATRWPTSSCPQILTPRRSGRRPKSTSSTCCCRPQRTSFPMFAAILLLGAVTGMRRGELVGVRRSGIGWSKGQISVDSAIGESGRVKTTKTRRGRTFHVDGETMAMLRRHCDRLDERASESGRELCTDSFLFSLAPDCATAMPSDYLTKHVAVLKGYLGIESKRPDVLAIEHEALRLRRQPTRPRPAGMTARHPNGVCLSVRSVSTSVEAKGGRLSLFRPRSGARAPQSAGLISTGRSSLTATGLPERVVTPRSWRGSSCSKGLPAAAAGAGSSLIGRMAASSWRAVLVGGNASLARGCTKGQCLTVMGVGLDPSARVAAPMRSASRRRGVRGKPDAGVAPPAQSPRQAASPLESSSM